MLFTSIWNEKSLGGATASWSFGEGQGSTHGTWTGYERSVRAGAEFDLTIGSFVAMVSGGGYEYTSGVTSEHQSVMYWSEETEVGGEVGAFTNERALFRCNYNARPYAIQLSDRSNTGYEHTVYQVDYVVPQAAEATRWTRANLPRICDADAIHWSGFEGND